MINRNNIIIKICIIIVIIADTVLSEIIKITVFIIII